MIKDMVGCPSKPTGELEVSRSMECDCDTFQCFNTVGWATGRASGL